MVGNKTGLVPAFMEFGPVIEGGDTCKALSMVPGLGTQYIMTVTIIINECQTPYPI